MTALFNPSPLVLSTLQNLSLVLDRSTSLSRGPGVAGMTVGRSEDRAFGGLAMPMARTGQSMPAKVRYGAITVTPRAQGSAFSRSPGVHPAIDRAYDNPGVRFGDRVRGGDRPTSSAGETTCHFSQTSVSKTSPIREMIKAARSGRRLTGSRAAAHVLYVEREGAPEQIRGKGQERLTGEAFTAEIERRGLDRSPVAQQAYIERAGAAEGMERKPGRRITDEELDALDEASFGTIGDTVEERTRFWLAVEEAEATPKGDRVTIKPAENPAWWARVAEHVDQAPPAAQKPIRDALARADGAPFDIKLSTDKAFALHQWAVGLDTEAPLEISPGRGGRTQTRVIAELPHEIDGRERLKIVRDFTQKLAEKGFPYWAVIHAPDANNDARNFHVHIAYYDRPAAKMQRPDGKSDVWDFEIQEERRYPNRTKYLVRPHQQNRDRTTHDREWVTELRKHWETVSNRVLEEAGVSKRYNLGTYESMGIDLEPLKHINSRTFNKERKGELTEEGPVLARRQWDTVHDRLVKEHEDRARKREKSIAGMAEHATRMVAGQPYGAHRVAEVVRLKEMGVKASFQLALLELHQDLTRLVSDRIASRPKLIMNAADKEEQKTRKKRGEPLDAPARDHPVAGAALFGFGRRSEIVQFLTTIYDGALRLDADNERRTQAARHNVRLIVQEIKAWIDDPGRPLQTARRYSPEATQALDDPERHGRREALRATLSQGFREASERQSAQILTEIAKTVSNDRVAQATSGRAPKTPGAPAPAEATRAPTVAPNVRERSTPSTGTKPRHRPETWMSPAAAAQPAERKSTYRPGRPDSAPASAEPRGLRPRPQNPLEALAASVGPRSTGAPASTRETTRTPLPAAQERPNTGAQAGHAPTLTADRVVADAPAVPRSPPAGPVQATNPVTPRVNASPAEARPAAPTAAASAPALDSEQRAKPAAQTVVATPTEPVRTERAAAPPPKAPAPSVPPASTQRETPAVPRPVQAEAAGRQARDETGKPIPGTSTGAATRPTPVSAPAEPAARSTRQPNAAPIVTRPGPMSPVPPTTGGAAKAGGQRPAKERLPPSVAALMEGHEASRAAPSDKPKPAGAPAKDAPAAPPSKPVETGELRITGAKRPEKRRRDRDRGRER